MSMSRKELQPAATMIGRAMLDANVRSIHDLPAPARALAADLRHLCAASAANFDGARFDRWALDVAEGFRSPITGERVTPAPATARALAVSA